MYTIHVDKENKLIRVELSGRINRDEVYRYTTELKNILQMPKESEYRMLLSVERLDPLPQELLPIMVDCMGSIGKTLDNIAVVYKKVVTRMQFQRIITLACLHSDLTNKFNKFNSLTDAIQYLVKYSKGSRL